MSKQVIKNYTFNTSTKTVTLTDFSAGHPVILERLALITDTTTNQILYNFADSTVATAAVSSNNIVTLSALPGGVNNSDKLRIDYDVTTGDPTYDGGASTITANIGTTNGLALDATLTGGTQQTKLTDGTNIANVLKSDGTAAGQNSQLVARAHLTVPFTTTTVQAVGATDVANYSSVSVHVTSQGTSSTVTFQASNDNVNWVSAALLLSAAVGGNSPFVSTASAGVLFSGSLNYRYFRVNVTGISAGTTAGTIEFFTNTYANNTNTTQVSSNTATGSAVPANAHYQGFMDGSGNLAGARLATIDGSLNILGAGMYVFNGSNEDRVRAANTAAATTGTGLLGAGVLGIYNSSAPTISSGNYERLQLDSSGNLKVNITSSSGATTQITDGTNTANVLKSDGTAAGQNSLMVTGSRLEVAYTTTTAQSLATTDVSNYRWVSVQIASQGGSSTVTFQVSNDNSNWVSSSLLFSSPANGTGVSAASSTITGVFHGPLTGRYFRLSVTGIASGTTAGTIEFFTVPGTFQSMGVTAAQTGNWIVGPNSTTGSAAPSGVYAMGMSDGTNLTGLKAASATADAQGGGNNLSVSSTIYNGTNYDRQRSASSAAGTTGTGLLGAAVLGFDGTNYQRLKSDTSGVITVNPGNTQNSTAWMTQDVADKAIGAAVPGNANYTGAQAKTALPTAASDGNIVGLTADKFGRQVVVTESVRDLKANIPVLTLTSTTSETTLIASAASTFNDITSIMVENTSATATEVVFKDSTAGTTQFYVYVPAGDMRGFSNCFFKQTTANNNWTATCTTSVASIKISGTYVKNQ